MAKKGINEIQEVLLEGLNDNQKNAVLSVDGTIQICSVAGSGKTRVLTRRIAYMINVLGISPDNIFITTFTKKASQEMIDRLKGLISKDDLDRLTIGTTHSICHKILRTEYKLLSHPLLNAFGHEKMLTGWKQKKFIQDIKKTMMYEVDYDMREELKEIQPAQVIKVISLSKNKGMTAEDYEIKNINKGIKTDCYIEFFKRYEFQKKIQRLLDLDDLLFKTIELFNEYPLVLKKYQKQFKYLLIDEAQDNNILQYQLIEMLGKPENNIFIVGDDDQSMYAFRGATPEQFINLKGVYNAVQQIELLENYRSNPHILEVANKLIKNNQNRIVKFLVAKKDNSEKCVFYANYTDEYAEGNGTIEEIKIQHEKEGIGYKDMAILFRTNAQSKAFEDALIRNGIPYIIHGGISFYERKEIKDIISYLELIVNPNNNSAFERVINTPNRFLGKAFIQKVKAIKNKSHYEAVKTMNLKGYEGKGVSEFLDLIHNLKDIYNDAEGGIDSVINYLLGKGGYEAYLVGDEGVDEEEGNSKLDNIETLRYALSQFESIEKFLEYINTMMNKAKHSVDGVQLMTIHKSKGLEFKVVFNVGVSEGLLPHFNAVKAVEEGKNPLAIEEERRLEYVGVTRAEVKCYISSVNSFNDKPKTPSRFIAEMELFEEVIEEELEEIVS